MYSTPRNDLADQISGLSRLGTTFLTWLTQAIIAEQGRGVTPELRTKQTGNWQQESSRGELGKPQIWRWISDTGIRYQIKVDYEETILIRTHAMDLQPTE